MTRIRGDRALAGDGVDELGFGPTAELLAEALAVGTSSDGLVVGVTGRWGAGKSSLINLTQAAILRRSAAERPHVVEFKPWLVGDRDALLQAMFVELVAGIDQIELAAGDATGVTIRKAQRAASAVREFAGVLGTAAKVAKVGGTWIPGVGPIGGLAEKFFDTIKKGRPKSLTVSKKKVSTRLRKLRRTLVVVIDDIDRLEPCEIVEVLRLVRSVADFPNITYVLSFDRDIVAHAVEVAADVEDGYAYIEKIVQITVPVPQPESFDLRRWFERELRKLNLSLTFEADARIKQIIDREGGRYLVTPRAVVRTLDSIRFHWAVLDGKVDLTDFIWLQLVKVGNPTLHEWISVYVTEMAAVASGRSSVPATQQAKARKDLDAALEEEGGTFEELCDRLAGHLPGVALYHTDPTGGIYEHVERDEMDRAIGSRRLASPDHYRLYFAFAQPANAPTVSHFTDLTKALQTSAEETQALLRQWQDQRLTSGVTRAEVMLDRLAVKGLATPTAAEAESLLIAYSNVMDELSAERIDDFGGPDVWRRAARTLPSLFDALGEARAEVMERMFAHGEALMWLTTIFRTETFAHGRHGNRPNTDRILTSDELDLVSRIMIERYRGMSFADFAATSRPLSLLFAWQQGGDEAGPRELLAAEAVTDEGLVATLEKVTGRVRFASTTGEREVATLSRSNIASLIDYDSARERITQLAEHSQDAALKDRATFLLRSFEEGEGF